MRGEHISNMVTSLESLKTVVISKKILQSFMQSFEQMTYVNKCLLIYLFRFNMGVLGKFRLG